MDGDLPKNAAFFNYLMNMGDYCYAAQQETKQVIANLTTELNTQKELVSHLKQENDGLKKELNETTLRLSTIMGMKITNDNPDIADLSDENRPTNLLAMFSELYDNEWTDAFVLLTQQMSETAAINWLLVILNETKQYCETQQQAKCDEAMRTLLVNEGDTTPDFVLKFVKENIKKKATSLLETECKEYMGRLSQSTLEWRNTALYLSAYTQECFRVCYLMSIQDPPVVFDTLNFKHGDILNTSNYKTYTKVGEKVDFMVWPCLRLCKDGRILSKGVVQYIPSLEKATNVLSATVREGPEIFGEGGNTQMKQNDNADFLNQQGAFGNDSDCVQVESEMEVAKYDVENNQISIPKDKSSIEHGPDDNKRTYKQMNLHDSKEEDNVDHPSSASAKSLEGTAHLDGKINTEIKCESVEENVNHRSFENQMKHKKDAELLYQQGASGKKSDYIDFKSKMEFPQSDTETRPSASMGITARDDNPDIADLRDENRPTKQAQMFSDLYDNAWTDAYELLRENMSETEIIKYLLAIIIETKQYCEVKEQAKSDEIKRALSVNEEDTIPDFVLKYITENRKKRATSLLETEYKEYKVRLSQSTVEWRDIACYVSAYTQECFRVCYLMSIQDPPVVFDTLDITHVDLLDTKNYKAYTKVGEKVDFMVWPCLRLCGRVLSKGVVQFIPSPNKSANARSAPIGEAPTSLGFVERHNKQMKQNDDAEFLKQQGVSGKESDDMDMECQQEVAKSDMESDQIAGAKYESSIVHGRDDNKRTDNRMSNHDGNTTENLSHKSSESAESCKQTTSGTQLPEIKSEAKDLTITSNDEPQTSK